MKLRKEKEQIPADFRKQMYESYKANMNKRQAAETQQNQMPATIKRIWRQ